LDGLNTFKLRLKVVASGSNEKTVHKENKKQIAN
jgi:hypothetical protein